MIHINNTLRMHTKTARFPMVRDLYRLEAWDASEGRWSFITEWQDKATIDTEIARRRYPARPHAQFR